MLPCSIKQFYITLNNNYFNLNDSCFNMKKRNFILGVLFLVVPLYHHLLWIYTWNKYAALGHSQKQVYFFELALFPEAIHQYVAFFFPIIAGFFLIKSMKDLKSKAYRIFVGFLLVLAVLCWGMTVWSMM